MGGAEILMKKLGHHALHSTDAFLVDSLRRKIFEGSVDINLPVIERDLYSGEPWEVLKDNDPWDVLNPSDKATYIKRVIFVFTELKSTGKKKKRFLRKAGAGTWHGTTAEKPLLNEDGSIIIGCFKSSLDFRLSNNQEYSNEKGHWMMHEYKIKGLESLIPAPANINMVLCQITHVVNKCLGIHHSWPKSPFEICFRNLKSQGFFSRCPRKRQCSAADDEHHKRRKLMEASSTSDAEEQQVERLFDDKDQQLMEASEQQLEQQFDDMIDLTGFLDMSDLEQIENDNQTGIYDVLGETSDGDQNLDHDEYEEFANQIERGLIEQDNDGDQNLVISNNLDHAENKELASHSTNPLMEYHNDNLDHVQDGEYSNNLKSHFKESVLSEKEKNMQIMQWLDVSENEGFNAEELASLVERLPAVDEDTPPIYKMHIPLPWEDDDFPLNQQQKSSLSD